MADDATGQCLVAEFLVLERCTGVYLQIQAEIDFTPHS